MNENNKIDFAKVETLESGFSKVSDGTKWGCIDGSARIIIPIRYDTIEFRQYDCGPQIVCGRSGVLLTGTRELGFYEKNTIYTGVYDLYDMDGTLLLGGFDDYLFDSISRLYHFFFGRSWTIIDNKSKFELPKYRKDDSLGKWLLLTEDFTFPFDFNVFPSWGLGGCCSNCSVKGHSVVAKSVPFTEIAGSPYPQTMVEGMKWVEQKGHQLLVDFPGTVLFDEVKTISANIVVCDNRGRHAFLYLKERTLSKYYTFIRQIDDNYAYVLDNFYIGLIRNGIETIPCKFSYITRPVNNWSFVFTRYPFYPNSDKENKYYCNLVNVKKHNWEYDIRNRILVNEDIDEDDLLEDLTDGVYLLEPVKCKDESNTLKSVSSRYVQLYNNEELIKLLGNRKDIIKVDIPLDSNSREARVIRNLKKHYWCSNDELRTEKDEKKRSVNGGFEHYGLMDALDGELSAYSNID